MLETLNFIFAVITGWSLGYIGVYYRTYDYQKYLPILLSSQFVFLGIALDAILLPLLGGLITCIVTVLFTYDPIFPGGHKIVSESYLKPISK